MASRLGWCVVEPDARTPLITERAGRILRLRSVELTTETTTCNANVSDADTGLVVVKASGKSALPGRFVPLQAVDSPSLLERAILEPASDEVLETATALCVNVR